MQATAVERVRTRVPGRSIRVASVRAYAFGAESVPLAILLVLVVLVLRLLALAPAAAGG